MYRLICLSILALCAVLMSACAFQDSFIPPDSPPLADEAYPGYEDIELIPAEEIFRLNQDIRDQIAQEINIYDSPDERLYRLLTEIIGSTHSELAYDISANTIASETFYHREANCLSLSIMGYALAREAGLDVEFQRVLTPDFWESINGYRFNATHVNLRFDLPRGYRDRLENIPEEFRFQRGVVELDFMPNRADVRFERTPLSQNDIVAMFYGNIAVDALLNEDLTSNYAYLRAADQLSPGRAETWINMGVLYNHSGLIEKALEAYRYALKLNRNSLSAASNYISLMESLGRSDEVASLQISVERRRNTNPFYQAFLARDAFNQSDFDEAKTLYLKAISLEPGYHEFYSGLADTYYHLGDLEEALRHLEKAHELAYFAQDIRRYKLAIENLRSLTEE